MNAVLSPLAQQAMDRALQASRIPPRPRPKGYSRIADKFVVRGHAELFSEIAAIGRHHGRSINSEMVAAVMEALSGHVRSKALLRILASNLGDSFAERVLADVSCFDLAECQEPAKFNVRFPPEVRDTVRQGVQKVLVRRTPGHPQSMNAWFLDALVAWVRIQRQQYALLSAAIELEYHQAGNEASHGLSRQY